MIYKLSTSKIAEMINGYGFLIRDQGTILNYKRDPFIHYSGFCNKANIDRRS